jgi:hypothetical protein
VATSMKLLSEPALGITQIETAARGLVLLAMFSLSCAP